MDESAARTELLKYYKGIEKTQHFEDYVKINAAFSNGARHPKIVLGLKNLEAAIVDRIIANFPRQKLNRYAAASIAIQYWSVREKTYWLDKVRPDAPEKIRRLSHLLTATLEEHEWQHGFRQTGAKVPVYANIVQSSAFIQALKERHHWKDIGAGKFHGEFTHRIQWYLLASGGVISKAKGHPAEVFSTLGDYSRDNYYLWDDLCDRTSANIVSWYDWRSPEQLTYWLISSEAQTICPVLHAFVSFRYQTRESPRTYAIRKLELPENASIPSILEFDKGRYKARRP